MANRWRLISAAAAAVWTLWGGLSYAEGEQEKALVLAEAAQVLAKKGDLDGAIRLFQEAYDLYHEPVLLFNIGRMHDKKGDLAKAREYYERFLKEATDPREIELGRKRLDALLDRMPGLLVVETEPGSATVVLDNEPVGPSPVGPVEVRRGPHEVRAVQSGFEPAVQEVVVNPGEQTRLRLVLTPIATPLTVTCNCPGASVEVDGDFIGTGPIEKVVKVSPGEHRVTVRPERGEVVVRMVEVKAGVAEQVAVELPRAVPETRFEEARVSMRQERRFAPWQWVSLGVGAAALVSGGVLTYLASQDRDRITGAERRDGVVTGISRPQALSLAAEANKKEKAGYALFAIGGVGVATGVVLWILDASRGASRESGALPILSPTADGVGLALNQRF